MISNYASPTGYASDPATVTAERPSSQNVVGGLGTRRRHQRSYRPPFHAAIDGIRYRIRDISLGGFSVEGWQGPAPKGAIISGELISDDVHNGAAPGRIPFEARFTRTAPGTGAISVQFVAINDDIFDQLMSALSTLVTTQGYVAELQAEGRFPPALLHMLQRLPPSVLKSLTRRQIDAMIDAFPIVASVETPRATLDWVPRVPGTPAGLIQVGFSLARIVALALATLAAAYLLYILLSTAVTLSLNLAGYSSGTDASIRLMQVATPPAFGNFGTKPPAE